MIGDVDVVLDARAEVGEGPIWDDRLERLIWVDIYRGAVHLLDPASGLDEAVSAGQTVGVAVPSQRGDVVMAVRDGFQRLDLASGTSEWLADVERELSGNLMNDGACDQAGSFIAGTANEAEEPGRAGLYRLREDHSVEQLLGGVTLSNGIDWSPDGRRMYYVDSALQRIEVFDYAPDSPLENRRVLVDIPPGQGMPDGLTVDADGFLWLAMWEGSAVHRFAPDGTLDRVIELPVSQVTSCAFGGKNLDQLFVTSASWQFDQAAWLREPHAGAVFAVEAGAVGQSPTRFAG